MKIKVKKERNEEVKVKRKEKMCPAYRAGHWKSKTTMAMKPVAAWLLYPPPHVRSGL